MIVDKNGVTFLEEGDTILDVRNRIGIIQSICEGCEEGCYFWESMVYYPNEDESYTTYRNEIKYILSPTKFS